MYVYIYILLPRPPLHQDTLSPSSFFSKYNLLSVVLERHLVAAISGIKFLWCLGAVQEEN